MWDLDSHLNTLTWLIFWLVRNSPIGSSATVGLNQILEQRKYRRWKSREKRERYGGWKVIERERKKGCLFVFIFSRGGGLHSNPITNHHSTNPTLKTVLPSILTRSAQNTYMNISLHTQAGLSRLSSIADLLRTSSIADLQKAKLHSWTL